jgi:hypothetical protein
MDDEVFKQTTDEVKSGWLSGPFSEDQLNSKFEWWVPARRFGIVQGSKTRVIDDFSECSQNDATTTHERLDTGGIDAVAALVRAIMRCTAADDGAVRAHLSDGTVKTSPLHQDFHSKGSRALRGKVFDLSKAYRQLARHQDSSHVTIIAVWSPADRCIQWYTQQALAFGATSSVYSFNWVARGIQIILTGIFRLPTLHYFDDYPLFDFEQMADNTQDYVDDIFKLLGWALKDQHDFSDIFDVLGGACDLSTSQSGTSFFRNKPGRIDEIEQVVDSLASAPLTRDIARSLRGRTLFARSLTFGRTGAASYGLLGAVADNPRCSPCGYFASSFITPGSCRLPKVSGSATPDLLRAKTCLASHRRCVRARRR